MNTARFLKYVWSFYNIMHERVNAEVYSEPCQTTAVTSWLLSQNALSCTFDVVLNMPLLPLLPLLFAFKQISSPSEWTYFLNGTIMILHRFSAKFFLHTIIQWNNNGTGINWKHSKNMSQYTLMHANYIFFQPRKKNFKSFKIHHRLPNVSNC